MAGRGSGGQRTPCDASAGREVIKMPVQPLPPLPRKDRERKTSLPPLPPMNRSKPKAGGWGGIGPGRWAEAADSESNEVVGTCAKCGAIVAAVELKLEPIPFSGTYQWVCGECR